MDTRTGTLYESEEAALAAGVPRPFVSAANTLSPRQITRGYVEPYEPCPCGSGQKFKFCCHAKAQQVVTTRQSLMAELNLRAIQMDNLKGRRDAGMMVDDANHADRAALDKVQSALDLTDKIMKGMRDIPPEPEKHPLNPEQTVVENVVLR